MSKKGECVTYCGEVFEKIYTKLDFPCPNCCFFDASDQGCYAPFGKLDCYAYGNFYWVKNQRKRMRNWIWKRRKRSVVLPKNNVKNCCKCMNCSASGHSDKFPKKTVFDSITASHEALAEKLVILVAHFYMRGRVKWLWHSTIIANGSWETREEAYNATVEKLKEVTK